MKLGYSLGYWTSGPPADAEAVVAAAERLGYDSMWTAETYGSDSLTPLSWYGSRTTRLRLGTAITQMAARTPTATAMAAMTLDHLTKGRCVLGLGASGPQVVEGWYGQRYQSPLARTREYVEIVRQIIRREKSEFSGQYFRLPCPDGTGLGKPIRSTLHPHRSDLPIYLAAEGPKNVALAAEIADGWLSMFYSPYADEVNRASLAEGFARDGAVRTAADFEVTCKVNIEIDDDPEVAADRVRPHLALYIGGMGAKGANFHFDAFVRMGFEAECEHIQKLYLEGRKDAAAAAVTLAMVENVALVGSKAKIKDELQAWEESLVTTLLVTGDAQKLAEIAEIVL